VDNVSASGWNYDSAANVETCDSTGSTGGTDPTPTPTPTQSPGTDPVHVGDLDGTSTVGKGSRWNASVVITVHDALEAPVANATVSGAWSNGASGSGSCTTDGSGSCEIVKNNIRNAGSVTFTVTDVAATGYFFDASSNHDPDGDSSGTEILILSP
jgi:hypothetical protein